MEQIFIQLILKSDILLPKFRLMVSLLIVFGFVKNILLSNKIKN